MKKIAIILSIFALIVISCGGRNNKTNSNISRESKPFQYDESGTLYSGAFVVSPDYFAELILNTETGKLTTVINGRETPFDLAIEGDLKEVFEVLVCISTEDLNKDGYVDFILTPYCSSRFPTSYVYLFDKEKKHFVLNVPKSEFDEFSLIGNTIGFITKIQPEHGSLNPLDSANRITFLNDDRSSWLSLPINLGSYSTYVEEGLFEYNDEFQPWAFDSGIEVFVIRCIGKTDSTYTVIVNENRDIVKHLKKHKSLCFETVEKHVSHLLVSTDFETNPVRKTPSDNAAIVNTTEDETDLIHSIEVKDEWIKIENLDTNKVLGWIRWKKGDRFMIKMFYSI